MNFAHALMSSDEYKLGTEPELALQEMKIGGVKIYPWRGDHLIGDHLFATHEYEPHVLPIFLDALKHGDFVLDVGANIGIYALQAAAKVGATGKVFAVEPIPRNVQSLCAGVAGNAYSNVSIYPVAASSSSSVIRVIRESNSSNGIVDSNGSVGSRDEYVPTQRLDTLLSGIDRLDVIKIDIEGHEPLAWTGIQGLVDRYRPIIFTEFSPVAIRNHSRVVPESYLEALFECARECIEVLHLDGRRVRCNDAAAVMAEWRSANKLMGLDGTLHLDLLVDART